MNARIRFIAKKDGRNLWGVYDRDLGSWPRERPGIGLVAQDHKTEPPAQTEADRLNDHYRTEKTR